MKQKKQQKNSKNSVSILVNCEYLLVFFLPKMFWNTLNDDVRKIDTLLDDVSTGVL